MEKYINKYGKLCFKGVTPDTVIHSNDFYCPDVLSDDPQVALHTNLGSLTVLDRMTGYGVRDIESGYREPDSGKFWLASGGYDVRSICPTTMKEAIEYVKRNANTCIGI